MILRALFLYLVFSDLTMIGLDLFILDVYHFRLITLSLEPMILPMSDILAIITFQIVHFPHSLSFFLRKGFLFLFMLDLTSISTWCL